MPRFRRRRGSGGGSWGSSSGRGGGNGPSMGLGGGVGRGDYDYEQHLRDIASRLGFQCSIHSGTGLQLPPQTAFMIACDDGNLPRLQALVDSMDEDDQVSLASVRMEGVGALHAAAMKGKLDICKYLVEELKFDVNSVDAEDSGFGEIAQLLLSHGATVDISSPHGTPLHAAAAYGKISIMQILLEHHADMNKVSAKLCTPLADTLLATPERLDESTCLECMKFLVKVLLYSPYPSYYDLEIPM